MKPLLSVRITHEGKIYEYVADRVEILTIESVMLQGGAHSIIITRDAKS